MRFLAKGCFVLTGIAPVQGLLLSRGCCDDGAAQKTGGDETTTEAPGATTTEGQKGGSGGDSLAPFCKDAPTLAATACSAAITPFYDELANMMMTLFMYHKDFSAQTKKAWNNETTMMHSMMSNTNIMALYQQLSSGTALNNTQVEPVLKTLWTSNVLPPLPTFTSQNATDAFNAQLKKVKAANDNFKKSACCGASPTINSADLERFMLEKECLHCTAASAASAPQAASFLAMPSAAKDPPTGEEACEDHDFDEDRCMTVGCCYWSSGRDKCMSDVGHKRCEGPPEVEFDNCADQTTAGLEKRAKKNVEELKAKKVTEENLQLLCDIPNPPPA